MSSVAFQNVSKSYSKGSDHVAVLNDLSLDLESGEFVSLMGPSGSGKSTVLNLLGALDHPDAGDVVVGNTHVTRLAPSETAGWRAANVGFVFQFYNLIPALTAAENIELPLLLTDLNRAERNKRVGAALELVSLSNRADHRPSELSGGQQQRVAIARAIIADPKLLLCDEPTGDLDRDAAEEIMKLLSLLNSTFAKTIVMVTHDPRAAEFSRRRLRMDKGTLVQTS